MRTSQKTCLLGKQSNRRWLLASLGRPGCAVARDFAFSEYVSSHRLPVYRSRELPNASLSSLRSLIIAHLCGKKTPRFLLTHDFSYLSKIEIGKIPNLWLAITPSHQRGVITTSYKNYNITNSFLFR